MQIHSKLEHKWKLKSGWEGVGTGGGGGGGFDAFFKRRSTVSTLVQAAQKARERNSFSLNSQLAVYLPQNYHPEKERTGT